MSVDSTTNKVGRIALVTYLNSWVDENQTEDNKYCKWETDKTTGRPVLKAAARNGCFTEICNHFKRNRQ